MTDNVFDQNTKPTPPVAPANPDPFADKLKVIVDEQGRPKYDNTEKALEALAHSQTHIKRLEDEAKARLAEEAQLREELSQKEALEEVIKRLQNNTNIPAEKVTPPTAGLSEEAIVKTLEGIVARKEAATVAQTNLEKVQTTLLAKFGDLEKTRDAVAAKAKELDLTTEELGALSSKSPQAVLAYFGDVKPTSQPTIPNSNTPIKPPSTNTEIKMPETSLLSGPAATDKNRKAVMAQIKERVYKELGVETA